MSEVKWSDLSVIYKLLSAKTLKQISLFSKVNYKFEFHVRVIVECDSICYLHLFMSIIGILLGLLTEEISFIHTSLIA